MDEKMAGKFGKESADREIWRAKQERRATKHEKKIAEHAWNYRTPRTKRVK